MASAVIRFRQGYSAINSLPLQGHKRSALLSFDFICPNLRTYHNARSAV
jgi:hypothetical protein